MTVPSLSFVVLSLVVRFSSLSLPLLFVVVAFLPFLRWLSHPLLFVGSTGVFFLQVEGSESHHQRVKGEVATTEAQEMASQDAAMQAMRNAEQEEEERVKRARLDAGKEQTM